MTAVEMKYKFDIKMRDLLGALNHPFTTDEINRFFNESQLNVCQAYAAKFETDENARQILSVYVKPFDITSFAAGTSNHTNGVYAQLPSDVLSIVSELVNNSIRVKPMTHDEYASATRNPFKIPYSELVWRLDRDDLRELITDGTVVVTRYSGDYIQLPQDIDIDNHVDCLLSPQIHEDVVENAISIALNVINRTSQLLNPKSNK